MNLAELKTCLESDTPYKYVGTTLPPALWIALYTNIHGLMAVDAGLAELNLLDLNNRFTLKEPNTFRAGSLLLRDGKIVQSNSSRDFAGKKATDQELSAMLQGELHFSKK